MTTRTLLIISAAFMAILGVGTLFLPQEVLAYLGIPTQGAMLVLVQLFGAHYIAFALLNWLAKDTLFGGIYQRPAAMANFAHFMIGALVLIKGLFGGQVPANLWVVCSIYGLLAVWFGFLIFFGAPVPPNAAPQ